MTQLQAHPAAGWYVDPSGRHEARYWDGDRWTDRFADRGVENHDVRVTTSDADAGAPRTETVHVDSPATPDPATTELVLTDAPGADLGATDAVAEWPEAPAGPQAGDPPVVVVPVVVAVVPDEPAREISARADPPAFVTPVLDSPDPVDLAPVDLAPVDLAPVDLAPVDLAPVDLAPQLEPEVGWYPDPTGRHEVRHWDGGRWTERVANDGVEQMDAPAADILDVGAIAPFGAGFGDAGSVDAESLDTGSMDAAFGDDEFAATAGPAADYDPDWYPDPTGRHEMRYFDGATWTEHVANNGLSALDPIADGAPVADVGTAVVPAVSSATSPNAISVEAAEAAFTAALKPTVSEAPPEPEPAPKQLAVRSDWAARPNALVGWIVVIGAGALGGGAFGPWAKATAPVVGDVVQKGFSGDGRFMLALALLIAATGAGLILGRFGRVVAFGALGLGTLAAIVSAVDMARISNGTYGFLQGTADATASTGIGLWACLVGAIVCIAGGIVAVTHR